jgi:hypothetical protein
MSATSISGNGHEEISSRACFGVYAMHQQLCFPPFVPLLARAKDLL